MYGHEFDQRIPVYEYGEGGTVRNVRPTIYHREAVRSMQQFGQRGIIGYKVQNTYGHVHTMTFKQFERMKDLFERGCLKQVGYWYNHNVPQEMALAGYDTESINAGVLNK